MVQTWALQGELWWGAAPQGPFFSHEASLPLSLCDETCEWAAQISSVGEGSRNQQPVCLLAHKSSPKGPCGTCIQDQTKGLQAQAVSSPTSTHGLCRHLDGPQA